MDLINYIGLKVKIILTNDYYYIAKVLSADDTWIDIIDMNCKKVSLRKESIYSIAEINDLGVKD